MKTWKTALGIALAGLISAAPALASQHAAVGRWNITVGEAPHTYPSWVKIEFKDGKHVGEFLGRAGGVGEIGEVGVDGNKVEFNAHGRKWTGTVDGDTLSGECVDEHGNKEQWVARRSVHRINLTGLWNLHAPQDELFETRVALMIEHDEYDIEGELKGLDRTVSDFELDDDRLTFYIDPGFASGESGRGIQVQVRGDKMVGSCIGMDGTEARIIGEREREWGEPIELFNGKNLDGWKPLGDPNNFHWKVVDGIMENTGGGGAANIVSERTFRDFKAQIEFRVPEGGNSGVYLRGRHEVQVADSHGRPPSSGSCGGLYSRIAPATNACRPAGQWEQFEITLVGAYLTVVHNGRTIIDNEFVEGITGGAIDSNEHEPGPIYLQGDHGPVSYRKITIIPAAADAAAE